MNRFWNHLKTDDATRLATTRLATWSAMAIAALALLAASPKLLLAQEPPVPPAPAELIGPPVYLEDSGNGLGDGLSSIIGSGDSGWSGNAPPEGQLSGALNSIPAPEPTSVFLIGAGSLLLAAGCRRLDSSWRQPRTDD
ncbi:MAG: hypothetical protein KDA57_08585 [Planctomycetales bacterium]|nr:hypothetical protein [Planctomycetales bacterium]